MAAPRGWGGIGRFNSVPMPTRRAPRAATSLKVELTARYSDACILDRYGAQCPTIHGVPTVIKARYAV